MIDRSAWSRMTRAKRSTVFVFRHGKQRILAWYPNKFNIVERLLRSRKVVNGCWIWTGETNFGYGRIKVFGGRRIRVTHLSLLLFKGIRLQDKEIACHDCDVQACFRPEHLYPGTNKQNSADMVRRGRAAVGDRNGMRKYPERLQRGDSHWTHLHPEKVKRGDDHWRKRRLVN